MLGEGEEFKVARSMILEASRGSRREDEIEIFDKTNDILPNLRAHEFSGKNLTYSFRLDDRVVCCASAK